MRQSFGREYLLWSPGDHTKGLAAPSYSNGRIELYCWGRDGFPMPWRLSDGESAAMRNKTRKRGAPVDVEATTINIFSRANNSDAKNRADIGEVERSVFALDRKSALHKLHRGTEMCQVQRDRREFRRRSLRLWWGLTRIPRPWRWWIWLKLVHNSFWKSINRFDYLLRMARFLSERSSGFGKSQFSSRIHLCQRMNCISIYGG